MPLIEALTCPLCDKPICRADTHTHNAIAHFLAHFTVYHIHDIAETFTREEIRDNSAEAAARTYATLRMLYTRSN